MQPIGTVSTNVEGDYPGIITVEFDDIPISGSGEEVV